MINYSNNGNRTRNNVGISQASQCRGLRHGLQGARPDGFPDPAREALVWVSVR